MELSICLLPESRPGSKDWRNAQIGRLFFDNAGKTSAQKQKQAGAHAGL